jgi:anti-anti-sigma regulatory factor
VARRHGHELRLVHAPPELEELLVLVGLDAVLRVESRRQPEEREDALGVEEERQLDDPAV